MATDYSSTYAKNGVTALTPGLQPGQRGWFQTAGGQQVYGYFDPLGGAVHTVDPTTGQSTGQFVNQQGQLQKSTFLSGVTPQALLKAGLGVGSVFAGGLGLAALTGGSAAAGAAGAADAAGQTTATLPVTATGVDLGTDAGAVVPGTTSDIAAMNATNAAYGAPALSAGSGAGAMSFLKPSLISGLFQGAGGLVGALTAKSAGNQMKQAGQQAAAMFNPFMQAGQLGLNRALALNGTPMPSGGGPPMVGAPMPTSPIAPGGAPAPVVPPTMTMLPPTGPIPAGTLASLYQPPTTQSSFRG